MIGFILLIIFMIASWVVAKKLDDSSSYEYEIWTFPAVLCAIVSTLTVFFLTMCLLNKPDSAETFLADRAYHAELIENFDEGTSLETVNRVIKDAKLINGRIAENKKHLHNKFSGIFYIQAIADAEPIEIPELHLKNFNTE